MRKEKDMSKLNDLPRFGQVVKNKKACLRDYKNGGVIDMYWGFNDEASIDQVFALKIPVDRWDAHNGHIKVFIDWQEMMHYGRAVNDWKYAYEELKRESALRQGMK